MKKLIALLCLFTTTAFAQGTDGVRPRNAQPVVPVSCFELMRAHGLLEKDSANFKFGYNGNITNSNFEVVAALSTASYGGFLTTATTVRVKSGGDSNDTAAGTGAQGVRIFGLDENFREAEEVIATNGTSASSASSTTFIRVNRAYPSAVGAYHGANADDIVIENGAGGTDLLQIDAELGQTQMAVYTVPADKTGYLLSVYWLVEGAKECHLRCFHVEDADDTTTPFSPKRLVVNFPAITGADMRPFPTRIKLPPKTDVWLEAQGPSGGAAIAAGFEIELVEN